MPPPASRERLFVALDVESLAQAEALMDRLDGLVTRYKVGSQLFTAADAPQELVLIVKAHVQGSTEAVTEALAPGLRTRTYVFNTIAVDRSIDDRLRGYATWISARNLANDTTDEAVQAVDEGFRLGEALHVQRDEKALSRRGRRHCTPAGSGRRFLP